MTKSTKYLFHEFTLDSKSWSLYRGTDVVELSPKMIDVLIYMVAHAGDVVSHEDMMRNVWPGLIVDHGTLKHAISTIRTSLGDAAPYQYIETIKNRGYRFMAPVKIVVSDANNQEDDYQSTSIITHDDSAVASIPAAAINSDPVPHSLNRWQLFVAANIFLVLAVIGLLVYRFGMQSHLGMPTFASRQLTANSTELPIMDAKISPDGHKLAFIEGVQLYVSDVSAVERHVLKLPQTLTPTQVEWYPDGLHILATSTDAGNSQNSLWLISILDGTAIRIITDGSLPSVSPKGDQIVFVRNNNTEIWMADANGENQRLIVPDAHTGEISGPPHYSSDGHYLLMPSLNIKNARTTIKALNLVNHQTRTAFEFDKLIAAYFLLGADSLLFTYYSGPTLKDANLLVSKIDLDTGSYTAPQILGSWPNETVDAISTTQDGSKIVMIRLRTQSDIYIASLSDNGTTINQPRRLTLSESDERPGGWIDNNTILMESNRMGDYGIYSQALDSNEVVPLASGALNFYRPTMSSDHNWLLHLARETTASGYRVEVRRKSLLTGKEKPAYTSNDRFLGIHCAADANLCVLAEHQQDQCIFYEFDAQRGRGNALARVNGQLFIDSWDLSRDGKRIGYIDGVNGKDTAGTLDLTRSPAKNIHMKLKVSGQLRTLKWDAASNGFYVATYTNTYEQFNLMHADLDGATTILRSEPLSIGGWAIPSPDGKYLAYQKSISTSNIWLLQRQ